MNQIQRPIICVKIRIAVLSLALLSSGTVSRLVYAQPVPVQQFNNEQQRRQFQEPLVGITTSTNAPELYPGENEDVGPQAILKLNRSRTLFDMSVDTQFMYTDNNRLTDDNKIDTALAINTVQFAVAPTAYALGPGEFAPSIGFRSQWYNYGLGAGESEDVLDFNAQTVFALMQYQYQQRWVFGGGLDYTRLLDQQKYNEFYTEITPHLFVQRSFPIRDNLAFSASWQGMYHFTTVDPLPKSDVNDRVDNTLGLVLSYQPIEKLVLQPFYRFQYTYYPDTAFNTDRSDYFNIVGAAVSYYFTPRLVARIFATGTFRESDDSNISSYQKFDTGIGAFFAVNF